MAAKGEGWDILNSGGWEDYLTQITLNIFPQTWGIMLLEKWAGIKHVE